MEPEGWKSEQDRAAGREAGDGGVRPGRHGATLTGRQEQPCRSGAERLAGRQSRGDDYRLCENTSGHPALGF